MSSFGVLPTGFSQKGLTDILDDIEARQKAAFGSQINTGGESVLGQNNAAFGASVSELWELLAAVYRSFYPDSASGEALDGVAAITGASRLPATKSTVTVTCTGNAGTFLSTGRVVSVQGSGDRFVSTADATISGGGTVDVPFESEEYGVILAAAGTFNIETPVSGWSSAANALDAEPGRDIETDEAFRLRRETLLRLGGNATVESIRADVLTVTNVSQAFVIDNPTDFTDSDSRPPHSVECIVVGGTDAAVADAIFESVAAGIQTYGHTGQKVTEVVTDSQGFTHTIEFTRPADVDIYIELEVDVVADNYPSDGDDQIKAALVALGESLAVGDDVVYERFQAEVFTVSGVFDCPVFKLDTITPPVGTSNIAITIRQVAAFDTSRITVTSTPI